MKANIKKVAKKASKSKLAVKQAQVLKEYFIHQDGPLYHLFTDPRGVVQVVRLNKTDLLQNLYADHGLAPGSDNKPGLGRKTFRMIRHHNVINGKLPIAGRKKGIYEFIELHAPRGTTYVQAAALLAAEKRSIPDRTAGLEAKIAARLGKK